MKKFKLGEFERNSAIVFAISMLANVVTYLYQIVMGNLLSRQITAPSTRCCRCLLLSVCRRVSSRRW